jgi:hypothetical protein
MRAQRTLLTLALLLAMLGLAVGEVRADAGPKPSMTFNFVYEIEPAPTIVAGEQIQCDDATCTSGKALEEAGPQGFRCTKTTCTSMAYGYRDYHRLVIEFSDGVTRESDVFEQRGFNGIYTVTVREDDLEVTPRGGLGSRIGLIVGLVAGGAVVGLLIGGLLLGLIVVVVIFITRRSKITPQGDRRPFVAAWAIAVPMLIAGVFLMPALPVTVALEGAAAGIYAGLRQYPPFTWLTLVTLGNLITQPLLWLSLMAAHGLEVPYYGALIVLEAVIWLVEGTLLYLMQHDVPPAALSFQRALILSLGLNALSFTLGLALPV